MNPTRPPIDCQCPKIPGGIIEINWSGRIPTCCKCGGAIVPGNQCAKPPICLGLIARLEDQKEEYAGRPLASDVIDDCISIIRHQGDAGDGIRDDLDQLIRVCLTNPSDIRGFIQANYPEEYETMNMAPVISGDESERSAGESKTETPSPANHFVDANKMVPQPCEIWVLGEENLAKEIAKVIQYDFGSRYNLNTCLYTANNILPVIRAQMREHKPVSLERCVTQPYPKWKQYEAGEISKEELVKAILDAAGVKYHD